MGFGQEYDKLGIKGYYQQIGDRYTNPHENDIKALITSIAKPELSYLDLGAGNGIVSQALKDKNCLSVTGCEPYLTDCFIKNTGFKCLTHSFEDIAQKGLKEKFDVIICSYAMHLVPESYLPNLLFQLKQVADQLVILTPHKRPEISNFWELSYETVLNKTTLRIYK